jgi:chaperonin GroEL
MLVNGVVPGGGSAYLGCRRSLKAALPASSSEAERMALQVAIAALAAPAEAIAANAGYEPASVLARIDRTGMGFDARCGRLVEVTDAGLMDSAAVAKAAVRIALAAAGEALTIDAVVSSRAPATATTPLA